MQMNLGICFEETPPDETIPEYYKSLNRQFLRIPLKELRDMFRGDEICKRPTRTVFEISLKRTQRLC